MTPLLAFLAGLLIGLATTQAYVCYTNRRILRASLLSSRNAREERPYFQRTNPRVKPVIARERP